MQAVACGPDHHADMSRRNVFATAGWSAYCRRDPVPGCGAVEQWHGYRVRHAPLADHPIALARKVGSEKILDQLACSRKGQGLAFVRPVFQHYETPRLRAFLFQPGKARELGDGPRRIERPE